MTWTDHYSALDRAVHRIAFAGVGLQKAVADIEDRVFAADFAGVEIDRPVFITSLPRAGTTLMVELLADLPEFAAHTYRNMPFLLCPLFWDRISNGFQQATARRERAHDDGVVIDCDSVEAFEEALWQAWWPAKYRDSRIALWQGDEDDAEFAAFFENHLRKIIALARRKRGGATRYVSKNNNNIARLPYLAKLFPDARILVPVREPGAHVASLLRQHTRFLDAHAEDAFAKVYMEAIGHREFGDNLMPLAFPGFDRPAGEARAPAFWLEYWIAAYGMLAAADLPQVRFVAFEDLCRAPEATLAGLLEWIGVDDPAAHRPLAARVTAPSSERRRDKPASDGLEPAHLAQAAAIYDRLVGLGRHASSA